MLRYSKIYWYFVVQRFKILMEYRLNFFIGSISTVLFQGASIIAMWAVLRQVPSIQGWTLEQILLIYGLLTLSKGINHLFADNLWVIGRDYIRPGQFDRFLVRPINPLFHLLADRICHDAIGDFIVGFGLVGYAMVKLQLPITLASISFIILMVISGGIIFIALNLITAATAFWIMDSIPVTNLVFSTNEFAQYPLTFYHRSVGILLTWLLPYGFASYYPASYLLGHSIGWMAWLAPLIALVSITIAYRFWVFGLKHYGSTGS
ncbi:MAG TPA: ABC transporter permease [Herpetosiphon sp.]|uniref:ABC transporter permease protein n=1 Tax=Herpetosiphon aurantiacus (strain ATCC 23779 / DSM 785 / 114-95) TaxID=316274 RepID=A9AUG8_HERA2|nr:ABC-2 family transporter protein [Herpetosiphon sp.]ABX03087.1 protein of unknown function DUF990 [Herpetosiphon aurantiacus DSM 785]HBW50810.1 ABC transporter permease [Herpetosiphon sp.]